MKKILVVCAAITLSCFLVRAQEAEDTGSGAGLSIISRLDGGLSYYQDEGLQFNFGNTSLYTLFEGNISENWSFTVSNHWIASDWTSAGFKDGILVPTADLAASTLNYPLSGYAGNSFFDEAHINFTTGNWEFAAGKLPLLVGGFEFDEWDYDVNPITTSTFWNSFTVYQYGLTAAWTTPDEAHTFTAQIATNQHNNSPAFGIRWNGELFGFWSTNYSVLMSKYAKPWAPIDAYIPIISIGNRFTFNDFTLTADFINRAGDPNYNYTDIDGLTVLATLGYKFSDALDVSARYCREWFDQQIIDDNGNEVNYMKDIHPNISLQANWFPIENLRIQGCAGIRRDIIYVMAGATYTFDFKLW
ncbi:MAG: hypothetical protein J5769_04510 [Bacteroidales bacterium]|nr:hypothetical protein [Bacteroidales bacterium]